MTFLIFIFCPVAGPQYYLVPPDNQIPDGGIIRNATYWLLIHFDIPASGFPSISALMLCFMLYLAYQNMKSLVKYLLPLAVLILLATIYLKIHYAIDVIAGLLSFPALFWLSSRTYDWINNFLDGNIHSLSDLLYSIPKVYGKH
jgi:membrane-associated phospholipid phosphatase